eukprot:TRINITY_DN123763_c0_g1_i1.p1 TRINITY_DN123763_c0_g1~~TRINITY_DN123763_c0_g1_i1.p1  ORF type:complete len:717 (+),score=153.81 TRINITY_DN123763_c0_g1_i1:148-2298(+)
MISACCKLLVEETDDADPINNELRDLSEAYRQGPYNKSGAGGRELELVLENDTFVERTLNAIDRWSTGQETHAEKEQVDVHQRENSRGSNKPDPEEHQRMMRKTDPVLVAMGDRGIGAAYSGLKVDTMKTIVQARKEAAEEKAHPRPRRPSLEAIQPPSWVSATATQLASHLPQTETHDSHSRSSTPLMPAEGHSRSSSPMLPAEGTGSHPTTQNEPAGQEDIANVATPAAGSTDGPVSLAKYSMAAPSERVSPEATEVTQEETQPSAPSVANLPAVGQQHDRPQEPPLPASTEVEGRAPGMFEKDYSDAEQVEIENGILYKGQWKMKKPNGLGELIWPDLSIYEGGVVDGKAHGAGKYVSSEGSTYVGEWMKGKAHGKGECYTSDGTEYEGEWLFDRRHGHGVLKQADGSQYEGRFHSGKKHGGGTLTCPDGHTEYIGSFHSDQLHGYGTFFHKDGRAFKGKWKQGALDEGSVTKLPSLGTDEASTKRPLHDKSRQTFTEEMEGVLASLEEDTSASTREPGPALPVRPPQLPFNKLDKFEKFENTLDKFDRSEVKLGFGALTKPVESEKTPGVFGMRETPRPFSQNKDQEVRFETEDTSSGPSGDMDAMPKVSLRGPFASAAPKRPKSNRSHATGTDTTRTPPLTSRRSEQQLEQPAPAVPSKQEMIELHLRGMQDSHASDDPTRGRSSCCTAAMTTTDAVIHSICYALSKHLSK